VLRAYVDLRKPLRGKGGKEGKGMTGGNEGEGREERDKKGRGRKRMGEGEGEGLRYGCLGWTPLIIS